VPHQGIADSDLIGHDTNLSSGKSIVYRPDDVFRAAGPTLDGGPGPELTGATRR
jgi:hypothetical protein